MGEVEALGFGGSEVKVWELCIHRQAQAMKELRKRHPSESRLTPALSPKPRTHTFTSLTGLAVYIHTCINTYIYIYRILYVLCCFILFLLRYCSERRRVEPRLGDEVSGLIVGPRASNLRRMSIPSLAEGTKNGPTQHIINSRVIV